VVSQVLEQQQTFDLIVWLKPDARQNLYYSNLLVDTQMVKIPLAQVATIDSGTGQPINRENVSRLIVVAANAQGRDLRSVVKFVQGLINRYIRPLVLYPVRGSI